MQASHLKALKTKHQKLERDIHSESTHAARDGLLIERLKKQKLHIKEAIERVQRTDG